MLQDLGECKTGLKSKFVLRYMCSGKFTIFSVSLKTTVKMLELNNETGFAFRSFVPVLLLRINEKTQRGKSALIPLHLEDINLI